MKIRAARTDSNQTEIVEALRKCGASVLSLAPLGNGVGDLLVGARNLNFLLEVKDGSKPPSRRKLSPGQRVFHAAWQGQIAVVTSVDEALEIVGLKTN
jgi:hypothetical protein